MLGTVQTITDPLEAMGQIYKITSTVSTVAAMGSQRCIKWMRYLLLTGALVSLIASVICGIFRFYTASAVFGFNTAVDVIGAYFAPSRSNEEMFNHLRRTVNTMHKVHAGVDNSTQTLKQQLEAERAQHDKDHEAIQAEAARIQQATSDLATLASKFQRKEEDAKSLAACERATQTAAEQAARQNSNLKRTQQAVISHTDALKDTFNDLNNQLSAMTKICQQVLASAQQDEKSKGEIPRLTAEVTKMTEATQHKDKMIQALTTKISDLEKQMQDSQSNRKTLRRTLSSQNVGDVILGRQIGEFLTQLKKPD